jgi:hypothetical protein
MESVESLVEVVLTVTGRRAFTVRAYTDGFHLQGMTSGESGWFRHWQLDPGIGGLEVNEENEVTGVRVWGCETDVVLRPADVIGEPSGGDVAFRMNWPTRCTSRIGGDDAVIRYQVCWSDATPAQWRELRPGQLWLGLSADDSIVSLIVEKTRPVPIRVPVTLSAGRWVAQLQADRFLSVQRASVSSEEEPGVVCEESIESARGNAWVGRAAADVLEKLDVDDVEEGEAISPNPEAAVVSEASFWQRWPVDVRATRWRTGDRTMVAVRFGGTPSERWVRLGEAAVWAGSSLEGELRHLVFGDVEVPPEGFDPGDHAADLDDPSDPASLARLVETARSIRFAVYGLVGELGSPGGFGSSRGIPSELSITFGDPEQRDRWLAVTSSRETDTQLARLGVASELVPYDESAPDWSWSREQWQAHAEQEHDRRRAIEEKILAQDWVTVALPVDGDAVEFRSIQWEDRWAAVGHAGDTMITIIAQGYSWQDVALNSIDDLTPYAEHERLRIRERMQRMMTPEALGMIAERRSASPEQREARVAIRAVIDDLMSSIHRNAGAPEMASLFTDRVSEKWGGRERYQRLLLLHTMLRPISGHGSSGDYPKLQEDGSALMRISLHHAAPPAGRGNASVGFALVSSSSDDQPEPVVDLAAIRAGEQHYITFHLVPDGDAWRIDTDLLEILIERLGTIAEVVRPLSQQG